MSSPLGVKRRRVENATWKLTKPFISPMRTDKSDPTPLPPQTFTYTPSSLAHTVQLAYSAAKTSTPAPKSSSKKAFTATATPIRKSTTSLYSSKKIIANPEEVAAQKAISSIEAQIRKTKNELDTLNQAQQIRSTSTDADLEQLTDKWRLASQAIAEDLFGTVKERVCRMGGVTAWREMEKKKHDRMHGIGEFAREEEVVEPDDADCEFDDDGEELPEDEQEYRKKMKRQAEREMADAADGCEDEQAEAKDPKEKEKIWEEDGSDDDVSSTDLVCVQYADFGVQSFTMDMMLRSLNIELDVIGYDKVEQRWTLS